MEDTPIFEDGISKECLERLTKVKKDMAFDTEVLSQKIDASITVIQNELAEIRKYLSEANIKIHTPF